MDLDKHLIQEVKYHRVLYDPNHSKYKDVDFKQQTWTEIGKKLMSSEDNVTSVNALKVRWKSLRDAYVKERKYDIAKSCGARVKAKKPWRLKKHMEFLAPFIQNRKELIINLSQEKQNNCEAINANSDQSSDSAYDLVASTEHMCGFVDQKCDLNRNQSLDAFNTDLDSFFRGVSVIVKGMERKNQMLVQKKIADLVMSFKLKEIEDSKS